jgi:hypothetical protein
VIALGDLALLVLRLSRSAPFLHCGLKLIKDRLLRERRLGWDKVGAFQLQRKEHPKINLEKVIPRQRANETCREDEQVTIFCPCVGEHWKHP